MPDLTLLPVPAGSKVEDSIAGLRELFPSKEGMNPFQLWLYDFMCAQFEAARIQQEKYDWNNEHSGSVWPFEFRQHELLKERHPSQGNYCVGVTAEQYYHWHRRHMRDRHAYEGEIDLTWNQMWHGFRAFMVGSADPGFEKGVAGGVGYLEKTLRESYEAARSAGKDLPENFTEWWGCRTEEISDWRALQFGDLISMDHSCVFLGFEKWEGDIWIRVFQSHPENNYKFGDRGRVSGLAVGSHREDRFTSRFNLASRIVPVEPYYSSPRLTSQKTPEPSECNHACPHCGKVLKVTLS